MNSHRTVIGEWTVLFIACALPSVVTLAYYVVAPRSGASPATVQAIYLIAKGVQFSLPIVWVFAICRERWRSPPWSSRGVGMGAAFGVIVAAGIWSGYWFIMAGTSSFASAAEQVRAKVAAVGIDQPAVFVAVGIFYTLLHSLLEEYYWRWFVFGRLRYLLSLWPAIVVSAAAFMAHHVILLGLFFSWHSPLTWLFLLSVMTGGAFWAWLYHRSGNLWGPWISHALIDAALFVVGYTLTFA